MIQNCNCVSVHIPVYSRCIETWCALGSRRTLLVLMLCGIWPRRCACASSGRHDCKMDYFRNLLGTQPGGEQPSGAETVLQKYLFILLSDKFMIGITFRNIEDQLLHARWQFCLQE